MECCGEKGRHFRYYLSKLGKYERKQGRGWSVKEKGGGNALKVEWVWVVRCRGVVYDLWRQVEGEKVAKYHPGI